MTKKLYSIKTIDGSRFEFETDKEVIEHLIHKPHFLVIPIPNGNKYFYVENIVSITETEIK